MAKHYTISFSDDISPENPEAFQKFQIAILAIRSAMLQSKDNFTPEVKNLFNRALSSLRVAGTDIQLISDSLNHEEDEEVAL